MIGPVEQALAEAGRRIDQPRRYGVNDCCVWVADVLRASWGRDPMARFRGRYSTRKEFASALRAEGCADLRRAVGLCAADARALVYRGPPRAFDMGLIAVFEGNTMLAIPAFFLDGCWHGLTRTGFAQADAAEAAWRPFGG